MKILNIKIDNLNIDLSGKVYYYAEILKDNQKFICQMISDGIKNPHLNLEQWTERIKTEMK